MKKLNLNRDKYYQFFDDELSKIYQLTIETKPGNLKICKFVKTGEPLAQLNIYENLDGTTTLHHAVGKNQNLSEQIAKQILTVSAIKEFKSHSFYIKAIRDEDFDALIEIINEYGNKIEEDKNDDKKRIVTIKGKQGDKIVIIKHSNNAFQVQGKPILLFNEIIEILSQFMPFEEIIEQQLTFYETNLTSADIRGELEAKLPRSYQFIEDKLKVIITPSLVLQKIEFELEDYSVYTYPILRAIEGVLKQIFNKFGITIDYKEGFGSYIIKDHMNKFVLEQEFDKIVNNRVIGAKICNLYKYYNIHRHSLFHIDSNIVTTKVISLQEATNIITSSLTIIDDCFDCF